MPAFNPTDIIKQFKAEQAKATAANAKQFQDLLGAIKGIGTQTSATFDDALARIGNLGATARERATREGERTFASGQQDLISSGLASSTLTPNLRRGVAEDVEFQQQAIDEGVGAQQSGIQLQRAQSQLGIGQLQAGAIQNQQNVGPDLGLFASLLQSAAAAGDPNQKVSAFVPPSSAAVNKPVRLNSVQSGSPGAAPAANGGGGGGTVAPNSGARIVSREGDGLPTSRAASNQGGVFGAQGQAISPAAKAQQKTQGGCPGGKRLFPGIGCF